MYKAQNKSTKTYVAIKKFKDSDDDEYVSAYHMIKRIANPLNSIYTFR